jgi:hypothetical protein
MAADPAQRRIRHGVAACRAALHPADPAGARCCPTWSANLLTVVATRGRSRMAIVLEAALSFLGLGVPAPHAVAGG